MKKIFFLVFAIVIFCSAVSAQTIHVQAVEDFSTDNPPEIFCVKLFDNLCDKEGNVLFKYGEILEGEVKVSAPKRMKRNAGFSFLPKYVISKEGVKTEITKEYPAKYTTKLNKKDMAKSAVLAVGNHFVKGISSGVAAVEGAIKNEEGNRLKSSAVSVYESSPLSYIEKGKPIVLEEDKIFLLNFKIREDDEEENDEPNYEYTPLDSPAE